MRLSILEAGEPVDGFLFVANRRILDFLNTRPALVQGPTELLHDVNALGRWLIASGIVHSPKAKAVVRNWRHSSGRIVPCGVDCLSRTAAGFCPAYRARLGAFGRFYSGGECRPLPSSAGHRTPPRWVNIVREPIYEIKRPADVWKFIFDGAATLLGEPERHRIRQCEACILHFFDTSRKGSRRWCSMNTCGNRLKVANYQRRKRDSFPS